MQGDCSASKPGRAIFLDRDGVINRKLPENCYVSEVSQFELLPDVPEALAKLKSLGFLLVLTTNQRGIARNFMTSEHLAAVHEFMQQELSDGGAALDAVYYCPHERDEGCGCRKPEPGMILCAARDLSIDLQASYMVGDSASDVAAGRRAGTRTVRIGLEPDEEADLTFPSLLAFALYLERHVRSVGSSTRQEELN